MKRNSTKLVCLIFAVMMLMISAMPAFAGPDIKDCIRHFYSLDNNARLNVHGSASVGDVIDHIDTSTLVDVIALKDGWAYIHWVKGKDHHCEGFVDASYLSVLSANTTNLYYSICDVYMHSQSKMSQGDCWKYHTGEMLKKNVNVVVEAQDGTWSLITYNGSKGWVPSIYLRIAKTF